MQKHPDTGCDFPGEKRGQKSFASDCQLQASDLPPTPQLLPALQQNWLEVHQAEGGFKLKAAGCRDRSGVWQWFQLWLKIFAAGKIYQAFPCPDRTCVSGLERERRGKALLLRRISLASLSTKYTTVPRIGGTKWERVSTVPVVDRGVQSNPCFSYNIEKVLQSLDPFVRQVSAVPHLHFCTHKIVVYHEAFWAPDTDS